MLRTFKSIMRLHTKRSFQVFAPTLDFSATVLNDLLNCGKPFERNITGFMHAIARKEIRPESDDLQHEFDTFFLTRPKQHIIRGVHLFCRHLVGDQFVFKSGNSSRLMVGEQGIGKSNTLLKMTSAIHACHPNVLPIYIKYVGDDTSFKSPSQVLSNTLQISDSSIMECLNILRKRNQYAFIFADELDQLYVSTSNSPMRLKILQELGEMGSQRTGRLYTILCGSSSALPMLISKDAVHEPSLVAEFPLVGNAPDLNDSKFSSFRVSKGSIHDIAADYETITRHYSLPAECGDLLYFLVGSNLQSVDNLIDVLRQKNDDSWARKCLEICRPSKLWDDPTNKTIEENKELMSALNDSLVKKNYPILKTLYSDPGKIPTIPFLKVFKTLNYEEVCAAANLANVPDYSLILLGLIDKGYYSGSSSLMDVGPARPADLLFHFPIYETNLLRNNSAITDTLKSSLEARTQLIQNAVSLGLKIIYDCYNG